MKTHKHTGRRTWATSHFPPETCKLIIKNCAVFNFWRTGVIIILSRVRSVRRTLTCMLWGVTIDWLLPSLSGKVFMPSNDLSMVTLTTYSFTDAELADGLSQVTKIRELLLTSTCTSSGWLGKISTTDNRARRVIQYFASKTFKNRRTSCVLWQTHDESKFSVFFSLFFYTFLRFSLTVAFMSINNVYLSPLRCTPTSVRCTANTIPWFLCYPWLGCTLLGKHLGICREYLLAHNKGHGFYRLQ